MIKVISFISKLFFSFAFFSLGICLGQYSMAYPPEEKAPEKPPYMKRHASTGILQRVNLTQNSNFPGSGANSVKYTSPLSRSLVESEHNAEIIDTDNKNTSYLKVTECLIPSSNLASRSSDVKLFEKSQIGTIHENTTKSLSSNFTLPLGSSNNSFSNKSSKDDSKPPIFGKINLSNISLSKFNNNFSCTNAESVEISLSESQIADSCIRLSDSLPREISDNNLHTPKGAKNFNFASKIYGVNVSHLDIPDTSDESLGQNTKLKSPTVSSGKSSNQDGKSEK